MVYLLFKGNLSVVDDFIVSTTANFILWPLAVYPFKGFLFSNLVALHDAMNTHLLWGSDHYDAVDKLAGT